MYSKDVPLLCLSYIAGLLVGSGIETYTLTITITILIVIGVGFKIAPTQNRWGFQSRLGLPLILVFVLAFFLFNIRSPQLTRDDISQIIPDGLNGVSVTLRGKILNTPTLNESEKLRFWLSVETVEDYASPYKGKLYTTVPSEFKTELHPGSTIRVEGYLYQPSKPKNPGQFDFSSYLKQNGSFAGISSQNITILEQSEWGFWQLRERIIQVHRQALGSPKGEVVSSAVLGRKAVSLEYKIQEEVIKAGLAMFLAASGFHVSLLLGVVLGLTEKLRVSWRFTIGLSVLILYVGLTGLQPSILRASLMGVAGLLGLLTERKVNSTRSLLLIATILLLINPLWINDLGFQFSFLATLGLIITLPPLLQKLDFIPPTLASIMGASIAIFPWVFPLQLFYFGTFITYSIPLIILVTPIIMIIILGGMVSGFIGLFLFDVGVTLASLLNYPVMILLNLVSGFNSLSGIGSQLIFGKLDLWQVIIVYALIFLVWKLPQRKQFWKVATGLALVIISLPILYQQILTKEMTIFATDHKTPIILIKNWGHITLINCGDEETVKYTLIPFLKQEGIQDINSAIALNPDNNWSRLIEEKIKVERFFYSAKLENKIEKIIALKNIVKQPISMNTLLVDEMGLKIQQDSPMLLTILFGRKQWGLVQSPQNRLPAITTNVKKTNILLWEGETISQHWLKGLDLDSAIAISNQISGLLAAMIEEEDIDFYFTGKHGAIQWTPRNGFKTWLSQF